MFITLPMNKIHNTDLLNCTTLLTETHLKFLGIAKKNLILVNELSVSCKFSTDYIPVHRVCVFFIDQKWCYAKNRVFCLVQPHFNLPRWVHFSTHLQYPLFLSFIIHNERVLGFSAVVVLLLHLAAPSFSVVQLILCYSPDTSPQYLSPGVLAPLSIFLLVTVCVHVWRPHFNPRWL